MLSIIASWVYISAVCILIGIGILSLRKTTTFSVIYYLIAGIVAITVYVEFFSIFGRIGAGAHVVLLMAAFLIGYLQRNRVKQLWQIYRPFVCSWE